ncbi:MAG: MBL fold metallo-hydrolase [Candidatus Paceibacterota bacterium]|jgi:glyoxylase-like metal-dependent hydrolase (beta-lactamase superfamily II)
MPNIKVLIEGYAKEINGEEYASSSVTLIRDNNLNILVDTGMNRQLLIDTLKKEGLAPTDINYVVLTHTHLDHCLLAGIFENAQILDDSSIWFFDSKIIEHEKKVPGTDIDIISTPGHDQFHCAVLINTEEYGLVAIAADLFWWPDGKEQQTDKESLLKLDDQYMKDKEALHHSREKILKIADYIVPGHGKPFKLKP